LNNNLKLYRQRNRLTQRELAEFLGIRPETICRIEKGKHKPSLTLALKIARTFRKSVEQIFCASKRHRKSVDKQVREIEQIFDNFKKDGEEDENGKGL